MTSTHHELGHFAQLLQAFHDLAGTRSDINLRGSASPPPLGFAVRLQPGPRSRGVELTLRLSEAHLSRWSDDGDGDHQDRDNGDRVLRLDLAQGFRWACVDFPDAATLAAALLRRMEDEVNMAPGQPHLTL